MSGYLNSPGALLAVAFPPQHGMRGACSTVADLQRWAPRLMSRAEAARLIFERNLECRPAGKGNRARRRMRANVGVKRACL